MERYHILSAVLATTLSLESCSAFGPRAQTVRVWADSPGAQISVNGQPVGHGSTVVTLPADKRALFEAVEGTRRTHVVLEPELSPYGIADLSGWMFIFPLIGIRYPGAWQLPQDTVPLHIPQN